MRRFLAALGGTACLSSTNFAADGDLDLTMKVKNAIAADATLRSLNLMVSVQDGVAVLGGAVPAATTNDVLAKAVKGVSGISDVRVNCWVPAAQDPLASAVKARLKTEVTTATPVPPTTAHRADLPPISGVPAATTGYSPVPPPAPPAPPGPPQFPTIPSPRVPVTPSQDVAAAVEAVRKSEARFDGLTLSVKTGTVLIAGTVRDGSEAWDLAAAIRRVPGVDKVVVGRTTVR